MTLCVKQEMNKVSEFNVQFDTFDIFGHFWHSTALAVTNKCTKTDRKFTICIYAQKANLQQITGPN